jgi:hypothetical protein
MSKLEDIHNLLLEEGHVGRHKEETDEDTGLVEPSGDVGDSDDEEGVQQEDKEVQRRSVKDLAAKLEITPKELYNTLDVKLSDGTVMTLSELKDLAIKGKSSDQSDERRNKDYNELMVERKQLNDVFTKLSSEVRLSEETINTVKAYNDEHMAKEMKLFIKAVPEWESQSNREKEVKQITNYAQQYGISGNELDALVTDHRLLKLIRDVATKPVNKPTDITPMRKAPVKTMPTNTKQEKLAAIAALIN